MCGIERDCEFCQISIGESPKSVIVYQVGCLNIYIILLHALLIINPVFVKF